MPVQVEEQRLPINGLSYLKITEVGTFPPDF